MIFSLKNRYALLLIDGTSMAAELMLVHCQPQEFIILYQY
jgi:hypothetical protein